MRTLRALLTAFVVAAGALPVPLAAPSANAANGPLPDCRIDDVLTRPRGYDDWSVTLVDWILSVGPSYRPTDLVPVANAGVAGGGSVRRIAIDDLRAMADAAAANGTPLDNVSTFRSYRQQRTLFNGYARQDGFDVAITYSARPGHSEHQLGLTIDFVSLGDTGLTSNWDETPTGRWMKRNAWKYGWLMSYPKGKQALVCYSFEPWHYRYVGRELARKIRESGLTIREYLWEHHTTVDPGPGGPTRTPRPDPPATALPTASLLPSAEASASPPLTTAPSPTASAPASTGGPTAGPANPTPGPTADPIPAGMEAPVVVAGLLLVLISLGLVASLGRARRGRRR